MQGVAIRTPARNGFCIGLFRGMFERNILTFNPGWDSNAQKLAAFTDVRELQRQLRHKGCSCNNRRTRTQRGRPASLQWTLMETRSSSTSTYETTHLCLRLLGRLLDSMSSTRRSAIWSNSARFRVVRPLRLVNRRDFDASFR